MNTEPQGADPAALKTRDRVCFYATDIEGLAAILIVEHHSDGSSGCVKLLQCEVDALFNVFSSPQD